MKARNPIIIANWKLNGDIDLLCKSVASFIRKYFKADVVVCPPYIYLREMLSFLQYSSVVIGSQNVSKFESGAYTGETSAQMLKEAGCKYCLIGHSERRSMFRENNQSCNIKVQSAIANDLKPVLCIGENAEERDAGVTRDVLFRQISEGLEGIEFSGDDVLIAYEPVWAIGTGNAASAENAEEVHCFIRKEIKHLFGKDVAEKVRILYGGSVNKTNSALLLEQKNIDGLLVGGASLDPSHFMEICQVADQFSQKTV
ncbi:triose-phosphate isomerase [Catenovulum agarivorans]|uniref:triose-phosphate isomerase n=1 Tax=Catenovulum agarivorans TaxID=1172192 RepID=UPI0002ED8032|nr:triose-phosphate isomerase [Catenovulum agarivorans]